MNNDLDLKVNVNQLQVQSSVGVYPSVALYANNDSTVYEMLDVVVTLISPFDIIGLEDEDLLNE